LLLSNYPDGAVTRGFGGLGRDVVISSCYRLTVGSHVAVVEVWPEQAVHLLQRDAHLAREVRTLPGLR
jgi:hypothetical protein